MPMGGSHQFAANGAWQTSVNSDCRSRESPPAKVSVFVFEDDHPLNGEHDAGGGVDILSPNEPGLGGFNITHSIDVGGIGRCGRTDDLRHVQHAVVERLAGTIDPVTGE